MKQSKSNHPQQRQKINEYINALEILVIDVDGRTIGPCSVQEGVNIARGQGLDLVEVSPNSNPPVCKILDFGKYKYEQNKSKKNVTKRVQTLKEIRMQPKISDHDLKFKIKHILQFLNEGHKVKVTVRFKGRELAHTELGKEILLNIQKELDTNFSVDKDPSMEGRTMSMLLSPSSKKHKSKKPQETQNAQESTQEPIEANKEDSHLDTEPKSDSI